MSIKNKAAYRGRGASNITAYEREWKMYPLVLDFLDKNSENYELKSLEKKIYLDIMRPFLNKLPKVSSIIDAGAGIGRFALELAKKGHHVHLIDTSKTALKKALQHLHRERLTNFNLHLADAADLSMFPDNIFDAALALELLCYSEKPKKIIKELSRVTKKKGLIVVSVEGKYGAILSERYVSLDKIPGIIKKGSLYIKNHLYVHYYVPVTLKKLMKDAGIRVVGIFGTHYVTDGIFHGLINTARLGVKSYEENILRIEKICRKNPVLKNMARAWVAVGIKK